MNILQKMIYGKKLDEELEKRSNNVSSIFLNGGYFQAYFQDVSIEELLSIPIARKSLSLISDTMASFEFILYDEHPTKGKIKRNDYRHKISVFVKIVVAFNLFTSVRT
ncbi:hypothetical protein KGR20_24310 [Cytobacillus oceanisediminis]|uniref:hypothetical protein n=1 Tax=Cytobacillus oceanisediminis TaxID=665099 RepID=UPI001CCA389C|nr:hypothetical protein [Cytobacillus oceanisediminis]MBZ9537255.1 hypothetical protein [Cytobacillus oceanisediminis]